MRQRTSFAVVSVAVLALATACGGDDGGEASESDSDQRYSIEMGMAHAGTFTAGWGPWLAARELGYYDDLGLDITLTAGGGSGTVIEQVAAGNVPTGNPSMPSVGEALLSDIELINIYTYSSGAIFGIFTPEDTGITSIPDLDGANIGISEPGGGEVAFLEAALREAGIDPVNDVSLIPVGEGGPDTFQAIEDGRIDAYSSAYNDVFALQTAGLTLRDLTPEVFSQFPARGIITTPDQIDENREALERLARATAMGTHFCFANPDACEQMLRDEVPEIWEENDQGISQGSLRYELSQTQVEPADPERYGLHDVEGTEAFIEAIASTMENPPEVDVDAFLDEDFLDYANDFDRAAVEADAEQWGDGE